MSKLPGIYKITEPKAISAPPTPSHPKTHTYKAKTNPRPLQMGESHRGAFNINPIRHPDNTAVTGTVMIQPT